MKKHTILGHVFELEPRAHDFLVSYVQRIDTYASNNDISKEILDDIKYNIIEKLYTAESPINEAFVMNLAEAIGEPEQIFENKDEQESNPEMKSNILERSLGKDKPMFWGVCYWIAKSLNIPVSIVRLIFLVAVFVYGTGLWLYALLALFVPFKDKQTTTGRTGNLFFELIRIIIWLGVLFFLGSTIFASLVGMTVLSVLPNLSNQSLQAIVPGYLYPLAILSILSLVALFIGSLGALIKRAWLSKTFALIAILIIVGSSITAGITGFATVSKYNYNPKTIDTQTVGSLQTDNKTVIINLKGDDQAPIANYFGDIFGGDFGDSGVFQEIKLLPSTGNEMYVEVVDSLNILPEDNADKIITQRSQVTTTTSGNSIDITIPNNIFSQKVPFSFAERTINIYIPTDKKIIYNNNSVLRYGTPNSWHEYEDNSEYPTKAIYCVDKKSFIYYTDTKSWRCADTTSSIVNKDRQKSTIGSGDAPITLDNITSTDDLTDREEEMIEKFFQGISLSQGQDLAGAKGRSFRVVAQDGRELPRMEDYRPGRINVETRNGIIVDVDVE